MESNEQTELTSKIETDSWIESRLTALGLGLGGGGIKLKRRRTHGHGHQCGDGEGEMGIRGTNSIGKNTIKINLKNN